MARSQPEPATTDELNRLHLSRLDWIDQAGDPLLPFQKHYPDGYRVPDHHHRRSQFMQALSGVLIVMTPSGRWIVPPGHAMWVPGGATHSVEMLGAVIMRSIYVEPDALPGLPAQLTVFGVTPFMEHLLHEAVQLENEDENDDRQSYLVGLILHEIPRLPVRPLSLPMPLDARLLTLCRSFVADPSSRLTIDDWAERAGMSRRTFTRHFQREVGMSLSLWRQQAQLFAALPRLTDGEPVTNVALDLGFDSAPAFTTMFKRMLGVPPREYLKGL